MSDTHSRFSGFTRCIAVILIPVFAFQFVCPPTVRAETATAASVLGLPVPGTMVSRSQGYTPALIKGIRPDPENPLQMNFIIESGDAKLEGEAFNQEARKLIKYFLTSLTVPPKELWVNLSPVEKDRLIPQSLGETEMGKDLLSQDYILKQLTATLMYPEEPLGKDFWDRVYAKARTLYGTTNIPISTFNKVWIVPDGAGVYEYQGGAYVIKSHLKVMLEEDYQALQANRDNVKLGMDQVADGDVKVVNRVTSDVVREVLIPEIEKEINEGKTFANLRQIYDAMILATWYKQALKESLLAKVYADQNKTKGVDVDDKEIKRKIYAQYLAAFEKGVYNYIKKDVEPETQKVISRRYFSGGFDGESLARGVDVTKGNGGAAVDLTPEAQKRLPGEAAKNVEVGLSDLGPGSADTASVEAAAAVFSSTNIKEGVPQVILLDEEGAVVVEFGTNGVRAPMYRVDEQGQKTAEGPFTSQFVSRVANAIVRGALTQVRAGQRKLLDAQKGLRILVAYDGRQGASAFAEAAYQAVSAFERVEADLADGITNSPDAAFQSVNNYDLVIQITASHNPENDNGIKLFTEGMVAPDQLAVLIQNEANSAEGRGAYFAQEIDAAAVRTKNAYAESSERKQRAFPQLAALVAAYRQANPDAVMVVDLFGGAASRYAEEFEKLGIWAVRSQPMSETQYRNRNGGPYAPNPTLRENYGPEFDAFVREAPDGSVYFGLDGDVDRLVVWAKVDGQVREVNPNDLGMAYLDYLLTHPERLGVSLEGKKLVVGKTLPTTLGLDLLAQKHNAALSVVPVGSKNFRSLLENPENVVVVATEESGHQIVTVGGETFFDDAVTQMYLVLEMMGTLQKNPARIAQDARQAVGFGLDFGNTAVKLTPEIVNTFITQMTENPQVIVDRIEAAVGKKAAAVRVVSNENTVEVYRPGVTQLKPEQGLHLLFVDSTLGPLASLYFRKSGTEPIIRIYRESAGNNDVLLELGKQAIGAPASTQVAGPAAFNRTEGRIVGQKLHDLLSASSSFADQFLKGGYEQAGYGVASDAVNDGSHAIGAEGNQGYYVAKTGIPDGQGGVKSGQQVYRDTTRSMADFFARRAARLGKPLRIIIKTGIGGQHTPFQGIAAVFQTIDAQSAIITGEYELGKDYEKSIAEMLKAMNADWDQVALIPSSKSGSTDETMTVFVEIFKVLLEKTAENKGLQGKAFADSLLQYLHSINFDLTTKEELPGGDLFKLFKISDLVGLARQKDQNVTVETATAVLSVVLGNMFFETTDRPQDSRLSAFIRNSGLDRILGQDTPGFGAMFDNVGGRWTADLHMMTFLAYHGLDALRYWQARLDGIREVRAGSHTANRLGELILEKGVKTIGLVVEDDLFWFGKSIEQNFNESVWQKGFANLRAIKSSKWESQKKNYAGLDGVMVINISDLKITGVANVFDLERLDRASKQNLAEGLARLVTTFYGVTYTVGTNLIANALAEAGYSARDVDVNNLENPATRIFQQNLFLRQPFVELGKGLLESRLTQLQKAQKAWTPGTQPSPIRQAELDMLTAAQERKAETNIPAVRPFLSQLQDVRGLALAIQGAIENARAENRTFVPFIYLEGEKFTELRDTLVDLGIEWVLQGTGDQHISYQQVLANPDRFLPFFVSFIPESIAQGIPSIGFTKGYLDGISPNLQRDYFAEASYRALTELRAAEGGRGVFIRLLDNDSIRQDVKTAFAQAVRNNVAPTPAGEDEAVVAPADAAQKTTAADSFAGINLDPALLDLQIKRDGNGIPLPLPQQPVENLKIEGFIPIIINVTPVPNLPLLLGLTGDPNKGIPVENQAPGSAQKPGPADLKTVRTGRKT